MPSGKRKRTSHKGIKYDLSEAQFEMLSKPTVKAVEPLEWKFEVRMVNLIKRGLFVKRKGAFKRTLLGAAVFTAFGNGRTSRKAAKVAAGE